MQNCFFWVKKIIDKEPSLDGRNKKALINHQTVVNDLVLKDSHSKVSKTGCEILNKSKKTIAFATVKFSKTGCEILNKSKKTIAFATKVGNLYYLEHCRKAEESKERLPTNNGKTRLLYNRKHWSLRELYRSTGLLLSAAQDRPSWTGPFRCVWKGRIKIDRRSTVFLNIHWWQNYINRGTLGYTSLRRRIRCSNVS